MKRRLFKAEPWVAFGVFVAGCVGMPALIWSQFIEDRPFSGFLMEFYGILFRFDREWWAALIAILIPVVLFEAMCTCLWAWQNRGPLFHSVLRRSLSERKK